MVVVARDIARGAVADRAGRVREAIPDALALAILLPGALDLIGGGGGAPEKAGGEVNSGHKLVRLFLMMMIEPRRHGEHEFINNSVYSVSPW